MGNTTERMDRILELIGKQSDGLNHAQIARRLNIPKSSLTLLLRELVRLKYVSVMNPGNHYIIGPRLLMLAGRFLHNQDIVQLGRPILGKLVDRVDETAFMAVRNDLEVVYVMRVNKSATASSSSVRIGQRGILHKTAAGKAMMAFQADSKIIHTIKDLGVLTGEKIPEKSLMEELMKIRETGVSFCREEFQPGINSFGAPVFNLEGRVMATITVAVPTVLHTRNCEEKIIAELRDASMEFSAQFGFDGDFVRERKNKTSN